MTVEIIPQKDEIEFTLREALEHKLQIAKDLGLKGQEQILTAQLRQGGYQRLSNAEYQVWQTYLPTARNLEHYEYDEIPLEVLERLPTWKDHFESLFIRTPERVVSYDPALFGKVGDAVFLLSRWGESDALIPFVEIVRRVKRRAQLITWSWIAAVILGAAPGIALALRQHEILYLLVSLVGVMITMCSRDIVLARA